MERELFLHWVFLVVTFRGLKALSSYLAYVLRITYDLKFTLNFFVIRSEYFPLCFPNLFGALEYNCLFLRLFVGSVFSPMLNDFLGTFVIFSPTNSFFLLK